MATHSNILVWRIPWTEEPGGLQSMRLQELDISEQLNHQPLSGNYKQKTDWGSQRAGGYLSSTKSGKTLLNPQGIQ